jgi:anti-sigma B factor antagonist
MSLESAELPLLTVTVWERDPQSVTIVLGGELDLGSAPKLRQCLSELADAGVINLVLDLADLTFLDASGLSLFVMHSWQSAAAGGSFVICNVRPRVMKVFEITDLVDRLSVSSVDAV